MARRFLTKKEVAAMFGITECHLDSLRRENAFPSIKLGAAVRFDVADVEKWIEDQKKKSLQK